ncbi:unnamed protein product [Paramecium pentaurelia]|uniref:Uncharacterized protein n=1 Tax=Paramecium pentaurelia TaxID=43138 RepID=A0A8S1T6L2_9CILI|nr:unnamed protein product [Paramecium pentaurelia]
MLHCCRCNKSRSPKDRNKSNSKLKDHQIEQRIQQSNHQQAYITKIKENEQMILKMYKELQDENDRLKSLINSLEQEKLELQEKFNQLQIQSIQFIPQSHSRSILEETNMHFSTKQQSFQFNDPSIIKYQSLKKLYEELIKDKDWDVQKKNQYSSSIQFLNNILQQKQEDLELAQSQIIKQNKIIGEYELKYNQLLCNKYDQQIRGLLIIIIGVLLKKEIILRIQNYNIIIRQSIQWSNLRGNQIKSLENCNKNYKLIYIFIFIMITHSEIKEFLPQSVSKQYKTEPIDQNISDLSFSFTHSLKSSIKPKLNDSIQFETQISQRIQAKPPLTSKSNKKFSIPIIRDKTYFNSELISDQMSTPRSKLQDCKFQLIHLKLQNQQNQKINKQIVVDKLSKQLKQSSTINISKSKEMIQIELLLAAYNQLHLSHSQLKQQNKNLEQEISIWKSKYQDLEKKTKQNIHSKSTSLQVQFNKPINQNIQERLKTQPYSSNTFKFSLTDTIKY